MLLSVLQAGLLKNTDFSISCNPAQSHALATSSSSVCQRRGARWLFRGTPGMNWGLIPVPREQQVPLPPRAHKARPAPALPARCQRRNRGGPSLAPGTGMCPGQADTKPGELPRRLPGQWQLPGSACHGCQLGTLRLFTRRNAAQDGRTVLSCLDFASRDRFPPTEN